MMRSGEMCDSAAECTGAGAEFVEDDLTGAAGSSATGVSKRAGFSGSSESGKGDLTGSFHKAMAALRLGQGRPSVPPNRPDGNPNMNEKPWQDTELWIASLVLPEPRWQRGPSNLNKGASATRGSADGFPHQLADALLFAGGQLRQRKRRRPHRAVIQPGGVVETEGQIAILEFGCRAEEADDLFVRIGVGGHAIPGLRQQFRCSNPDELVQ